MIALRDERTIRVRRNGLSHVSIGDVHDRFTVDRAHALALADALDGYRACQVSSNDGRVWAYNGGIHLGQLTVEQRHGPWSLDDEARAQLADEIREAVNG